MIVLNRRTGEIVESTWQRLQREAEARVAGCTHDRTKLVIDPDYDTGVKIYEGGRRRVCIDCNTVTEWIA